MSHGNSPKLGFEGETPGPGHYLGPMNSKTPSVPLINTPAEPLTATLLISTQDQPGLVAAVSGFVFSHGGNILHADQHTDRLENRFYMRLTWDLAHSTLAPEKLPTVFAEFTRSRGMQGQLFFSHQKPRIALFASRSLHCLYDLLIEQRQGSLAGEIALIISNHEDARDAARHFDIPFEYLPMTSANKAQVEARQRELLAQYQVDCVVLARYMQILSPQFSEDWQGRIINIHHGFLPAFQGAKPYHQAHDRGVKIIGATAHYVTSELDQGPIIVQDVIAITHRDGVEEMVMKGRDLERRALTQAVRLHLQHRVLISGNRTIVFS